MKQKHTFSVPFFFELCDFLKLFSSPFDGGDMMPVFAIQQRRACLSNAARTSGKFSNVDVPFPLALPCPLPLVKGDGALGGVMEGGGEPREEGREG